MQRIYNNPDMVVEDMLKGFLKAHRDIVAPTNNPRTIKYKHAPIPGKVGVVTGGGSGHKPAFIGYVGRNMVDAVAVGEVFSSPTAKAFTMPASPQIQAKAWPACMAITPVTT